METTDSVFLNFEPCPSCGSRDNLSRWSDGHGWCFGCGHWEPPTLAGQIRNRQSEAVSTGSSKLGQYPSDATPEIGAKGWTWLNKYGILKKELTNFRWSDTKQWLIYEIEGQTAWQARGFAGDSKSYHTHGDVSNILHILGQDNDELILCEDVLSAIKIARHRQAMPLWGSNIPLKTLVRLSKRFSKLGIWLDKDKSGYSLKSNRRASQMGFKQVRSIITTHDPKEYNDEAIMEFLERVT